MILTRHPRKLFSLAMNGPHNSNLPGAIEVESVTLTLVLGAK